LLDLSEDRLRQLLAQAVGALATAAIEAGVPFWPASAIIVRVTLSGTATIAWNGSGGQATPPTTGGRDREPALPQLVGDADLAESRLLALEPCPSDEVGLRHAAHCHAFAFLNLGFVRMPSRSPGWRGLREHLGLSFFSSLSFLPALQVQRATMVTF
jgi:hypothetical protein